MGCISSKAITRSLSIREELSHGFQCRSAMWEELLASHSGDDQLFAFVCPSKLKTSSFTLPTADSETAPATKYVVDAWDLIADVNAKPEVETAPDVVAVGGPADSCKFTRSKSCQTMREKEMLTGCENRLDLNYKVVGGSRSFHTVEEYDALLERIHGTRRLECFEDCFPWDDVKLPQPSSLAEDEKKKARDEEDDLNVDGQDSTSLKSCDNYEVGWKRKAVARGLKSLDMSTLELPAIAGLKQRVLVQGQIYSPGTYVTPKFGSYNAPATQDNDRHQNTVFTPELVAAFEDCMQQLQVEEDSILRHLDDVANT